MEITTYAPVLIPTLNRYDKFKVCLESLERCTWADRTIVYVAVDFPPSDKYKEGWEKICSYLEQKINSNKFKELNVAYRDHNCGVGKKESNSSISFKEIRKNHDRFIFSEDDNEFSPNFLMYMNYALEKYKDDDRVFRVVGYNFDNDYPASFNGEYYLEQYQYYPWGDGRWVGKLQSRYRYYKLDYLKSIVKDKQKRELLLKKHPHTLEAIFTMLKKRTIQGDAIFECFMFLDDKYIVCPRISKVRNHGNDESGVNFKGKNERISTYFSQQPIDERIFFEWDDNETILERKDVKQKFEIKRPWYRQLAKRVILHLDTFLLVHFDYLPSTRYI